VPPDRLTDRYLLQQIAAVRPPDSIVVEEAPSSRAAMHDHLPMLEPIPSTPVRAADSAMVCRRPSASPSPDPTAG